MEGFLGVMFDLVLDVLNYVGELGMRVGKRAEAFLPREAASDPFVFVYVVCGASFDVADEVRESHVWFQTD